MLRGTDIQNGEIHLKDILTVSRKFHETNRKSQAQPGDVVIVRIGRSGEAAVVPDELPEVNCSGLIIAKNPSGVTARFLRDFLKSPDGKAASKAEVRGVTRSTLNTKKVAAAVVPVAPEREQLRIIAKLDRLSARSDAARDHLSRTTKLAARTRQAILRKAFSGSLTVQWRDEHDLSHGHKVDLSELELDRSERGDWPASTLPSTWRWLSFREVFDDLTDSRRKLPRGSYQPEGRYAVIDQGEEFTGRYSDEEDLVHRGKPPTIIFGDHTRCVKFVGTNFIQGADGVKVLKARAGTTDRYAYWLMRCIDLPDKGYSRHMKFLKASVFPVSTQEEQSEIVRRIEAAFARIHRLTEEATRATHLLDRLDERLLAKAFCGELVPQDPADEPAEALLARIRAARAGTPTQRSRRVAITG